MTFQLPRTARFILRKNMKTGRVARYGMNQCSPNWVFADVATAQAWLTKIGARREACIRHAGETDEISGTYQYTLLVQQKEDNNES